MACSSSTGLERHALSCLAFGVIGDAMGTPTELMEPEDIERQFGWVESFDGDGTDDTNRVKRSESLNPIINIKHYDRKNRRRY